LDHQEIIIKYQLFSAAGYIGSKQRLYVILQRLSKFYFV